MNINIHSTSNETKITAHTMTVTPMDGRAWCVIEMQIKGRRGEDDITFFLPISEQEKVRQIAALWNELSVANAEVKP